MKELTIVPNMFDRKYLKDHSDKVFADRELVIEREVSGEQTMLRFKIGDGIHPYSTLQYISSLYALFPQVKLCDTEYNNSVTLLFDSKGGEH